MLLNGISLATGLRFVRAAAIGSAIALGGASAAQAASDLTGTNVTFSWLFPDTSTTYAAQTFTVGPGPELSCPGGYAGGGLCTGFYDSSTIDIGVNTLSLTINDGSIAWAPTTFNGYEFSGLSAGGSWTGYTLSTDFSGLDTSRVIFTPDAVYVNMQGITPQSGESFTITLNAASAPEPAAWALMLVGFGGLGAALRSRRRTAAAAG